MKKINAVCLVVLAFVSIAAWGQSGAESRPDDLEVNCTPVNKSETRCTVRTPSEGFFVVTAIATARADDNSAADRWVDARLSIAGKVCNESTANFTYYAGEAKAVCKPRFLENITYTVVATSRNKGSTAYSINVTVQPDVQMGR